MPLILSVLMPSSTLPIPDVEYLVMAGGGGGGGADAGVIGGGGGAGGTLTGTLASSTFAFGVAYSVTIGAAGSASAGWANGGVGGSSQFHTITTTGGGFGGAGSNGGAANAGGSGGSAGGGGGSGVGAPGASGTPVAGQGNAAGVGASGAAGGGGGKNSAGGGSTGGVGLTSSISGSSVTYATGGGGNGVWGNGVAANPKAANTGYGGDGGWAASGGAGGSGIVIVRYLGLQRANGGTITQSGGYTIHKFTSSGTFTFFGPTEGYQLARSLRFNSANTNRLDRTPVITGNRLKWTWSAFAKRGQFGTLQVFLGAGTTTNDEMFFSFGGAANLFRVAQTVAGGTVIDLSTTAALSDQTRWYHLQVVYDSANGTAADRLKLYVDGIRQTVTGTLPSASLNSNLNGTALHNYGRRSSAADLYFNGYLADIHFVDGQALDPSAFAEGTMYGWVAKNYTGTYGTGGYHLDFADNSATTAATLGKDRSGMSNLFAYSDNFSNGAYWANSGTTFTSGQSDPLGGTGAFLFTSNTAGNAYVTTSYSFVSGQTYTCTSYAKGGTNSLFRLHLGGTNGAYRDFDVITGTIGSGGAVGSGTYVGATISDAGGGWWKCSVTVTYNTSATETIYIASITSTLGATMSMFRADLTLGATVPNELQYTAGTAISNKNWTPTNFSVTAGASNDCLVDAPSNPYGTDTGAGGEVHTNYCTMNPNDATVYGPVSDGSLYMSGTSVTLWGTARSTISKSSGQWYFEATARVSTNFMIGIMGTAGSLAGVSTSYYVGQGPDGWGYNNPGTKYTNGVSTAYGASYTTNDVIGVALNLDAGTLTFYKNGVSQGVAYSSLSGTFTPAFSNLNSSAWEVNFGQRPFAYAAPAGFKAFYVGT